MTPRELSVSTVTAKLQHIVDLLDALDQIAARPAEEISGDPVLRLAIERVLTQLVELAASINAHMGAALGQVKATSTYRKSFGALGALGVLPEDLAARLADSAGMRNILVHNYADIDWPRVVTSIPMFRLDYRDYVQHVSRWLGEQAL